MTRSSERYDVWLSGAVVGALDVRGDHTRFSFAPGYWDDPQRHVLGLRFEDVPTERTSAALRVPPWFSNLLPEGTLRDWVSSETDVSDQRELPLLVRLGADLPGAVQVLPASADAAWLPARDASGETEPPVAGSGASWRFSLAGVGLKFSMTRANEGLSLPATGVGGDWIVKLPDPVHPQLPAVEMAVMSWGALSGVHVPERLLLHRDEVSGLPDAAWRGREEVAYAVRRFDRGPDRGLIHTEDFAQVRGFWPDDKYRGTYETLASLVYRGRDDESLLEFVRRLVFCVISGNGDAHLKNFSLIYPDGRSPRLAPAYDLVSTAAYAPPGAREELALPFNRSKLFVQAGWEGLRRLQGLLGVGHLDLVAVGAATAAAALESWPAVRHSLAPAHDVRRWLDSHVAVAGQRFVP